uniref:Uncharacterized protein n=1 Tax=Eucampia antarctica TaxID=49252 RepID=A0A7S2SDH3_9STRA|mmetsp:Transcript_6676/g.6264  ORF Transcript_6676/g.6264 Transcript_6676/m.6264 type:complete len:294 (+) Transcript_6676:56-937(+)
MIMMLSRLSYTAFLGLCYGLLLESSNAFAPGCRAPTILHRPSTLFMATEKSPEKKKLTSTDIINRARESVGLPVDEPTEPLFADDLLEDMKSILLSLERRVRDGPGSLDVEEVTKFESNMGRIVKDMNEKLGAEDVSQKSDSQPLVCAPKFKSPETSTLKPTHNPAPLYDDLPTSSSSAAESTNKPSPVFEAPDKTETHELVDKVVKNEPPKREVIDLSTDKKSEYEGGLEGGIAKGTRSTYVIAGMDEMSPEEYRDALQKSVSDRQTRRREMGIVGNQASGNYLDNLKNSKN